MNILFKFNNKTIYDIDTTILYTYSYNYTQDIIYFINNIDSNIKYNNIIF